MQPMPRWLQMEWCLFPPDYEVGLICLAPEYRAGFASACLAFQYNEFPPFHVHFFRRRFICLGCVEFLVRDCSPGRVRLLKER